MLTDAIVQEGVRDIVQKYGQQERMSICLTSQAMFHQDLRRPSVSTPEDRSVGGAQQQFMPSKKVLATQEVVDVST